ncbi:hypothetical protein [Polyangium aurulentum]|uniref:hypothetical protein n=1 Tax=Polyangium aurulentum TaxID=2567896 RepID=UPI0010AE3F44|nr:hypothetical protein [Polyangium aurulentum]UQA54680.1 hypothetical protein E8A73_025245 [Polyangium aurulentum]
MAALIALASGCGMHVHSTADHALAESARRDFHGARLGAGLRAERDTARALLLEELAAVRADGEARRDHALAEILASDDGFTLLRGLVDDRARELVGGDREALRQLVRRARALQRAESALDAALSLYRTAAPALADPGVSPTPLACPLPEGMARPATMATFIDGYERACKDVIAARDELKKAAPGGEIGRLLRVVDEERAEDETNAAKAESLLRDYQRASKSYLDAARPGAVQGAALEVDARLQLTLKTLDALDKSGPTGHLMALEERYRRITSLTASAAQGEAAEASGVDAPQAVAQIVAARIVEIEKARAGEALPLLLLEADRLRITLEAEQRAERRRKARRGLHLAERDASFAEARSLVLTLDALDALDKMSAPPASASPSPAPSPRVRCTLTPRIDESFAKSEPVCREPISLALIHFTMSWTAGRIPAENARWLARGVMHEEAIDASGAALALWQGMLAVPLEEIARYHESGVVPAQLAQILVTALGLGAIAVGVVATPGGAP